MEIIDITRTLGMHTAVWQGDPPIYVAPSAMIDNGDVCNLTAINIGSHSSTHVDAPFHVMQTGKKLNEIPLNLFCGECLVFDAHGSAIITRDLIEGRIPKQTRRLLFKTDNSDIEETVSFRTEYCALSSEAAQYAALCGVELIGIDYMSFGAYKYTLDAHMKFFLNGGLAALENIDMKNVEAGIYTLMCLPLKLDCGDGAPARAVLIK